MITRQLVGALLSGALFFAHGGPAHAQEQAATSGASGAIVVALSQDATPAAKPLARAVYRDEALRPSIDDATARVLVGEPAGDGASSKLKELGELRASAATASSEATSRRLLAAIGADAKAKIVVSVTIEGGRPVAKILRVETAAFEGIELGATTETTQAGEKIVQWPGAVEALRKLVPPPPAKSGATSPASGAAPSTSPASASTPASGAQAPAGSASKAPTPGPLAPSAPPKGETKGETSPSESKSVWNTPWFWAILGGAVAVGAGAFAIAKVTQGDSTGTLRLQGRVSQ